MNTNNISFSGHSLGGAIAQLQSVYFINSMYGSTKTFEPYGVRSEAAPTFRAMHNGQVYYLTLNPKKSLQSQVCALGYDWDCDGWQEKEDKILSIYAGSSAIIDSKIANFIREGDMVGTIAEPIGAKRDLLTGLNTSSTGELHSITNYRYQGYTASGSLLDTKINLDNVKILKTKGTQEQKSKYRACFSKMTNYEVVL